VVIDNLGRGAKEIAMDRGEAFDCLEFAEGVPSGSEIEQLEPRHDQLQQALAWFIDNGLHLEALRLATALSVFWMERGHLAQGRERLHQLLKEPDAKEPSEVRVRRLNAAALLAFRQGDDGAAGSLLEESLDTARSINDREGEAWALSRLSRVSLRDHDFARVRQRAQASVDIFRELGDREGEWSPLHVLAYATMMEGDLDKARTLFEQSLELASSLGRSDQAGGEHQNLGVIETRSGNLDVAIGHYRRALDVGLHREDTYLLPYVFLGFAVVAAERGDAERAARLIGVTDEMLESSQMVLDPGDQPDHDRAVELTRASLGDRFEGLALEGKNLSLQGAVELARDNA
jgi:tetratricopeptide (TPR) repeat protein